jgi:hypothetical protein
LEVVVESYQAGHLIDLLSVSTTISPAGQPAASQQSASNQLCQVSNSCLHTAPLISLMPADPRYDLVNMAIIGGLAGALNALHKIITD